MTWWPTDPPSLKPWWQQSDAPLSRRQQETTQTQSNRHFSLCGLCLLSFPPCLSPMCFQSVELKVAELLCDQRVYYSDHWLSSPQLTRAPEHWGPLYISCSHSASIFLSISYLPWYIHMSDSVKEYGRKRRRCPCCHCITSSLPCWQWTWNGANTL